MKCAVVVVLCAGLSAVTATPSDAKPAVRNRPSRQYEEGQQGFISYDNNRAYGGEQVYQEGSYGDYGYGKETAVPATVGYAQGYASYDGQGHSGYDGHAAQQPDYGYAKGGAAIPATVSYGQDYQNNYGSNQIAPQPDYTYGKEGTIIPTAVSYSQDYQNGYGSHQIAPQNIVELNHQLQYSEPHHHPEYNNIPSTALYSPSPELTQAYSAPYSGAYHGNAQKSIEIPYPSYETPLKNYGSPVEPYPPQYNAQLPHPLPQPLPNYGNYADLFDEHGVKTTASPHPSPTKYRPPSPPTKKQSNNILSHLLAVSKSSSSISHPSQTTSKAPATIAPKAHIYTFTHMQPPSPGQQLYYSQRRVNEYNSYLR